MRSLTATVADMANRKTKTHGPTTRTVARNVRRLREGQGLSAAKLSARTEELGYSIPPEGIQKIEAAADGRPGARHINADELMVLAVALGVNPSALLLPNRRGFQQTAEITGYGEIDSVTAWNWADGKQPLIVDPDEREQAEFIAKARPMEVRRSVSVAEINRARAEGRSPHHEPYEINPRNEQTRGEGTSNGADS